MNITIQQAANCLRQGKVVALPTETVYGLAADARNPAAIQTVFDVKGRPQNHPLIVHLLQTSELSDWACDIPPTAYVLAKTFWPGPLTLILKKQPSVSSLITGGQDSIALRVPQHPVMRAVLEAFQGAVVAPSANPYQQLSPTQASHVTALLGADARLEGIVDGGTCSVGIESTIVSLLEDTPRLLRPGMISKETLESVLNTLLLSLDESATLRAPGLCTLHYAPRKPVHVFFEKSALLECVKLHTAASGVLFSTQKIDEKPANWHWQAMPENPNAYASVLYGLLHEADNNPSITHIVIHLPQANDLAWLAITDRIKRMRSREET